MKRWRRLSCSAGTGSSSPPAAADRRRSGGRLDTKTGDEVAVKRLHPIVFADETGRARLKREFEALRSLDEPHIVRVRDLKIARNEGAIILDYVPGHSLADRLISGPPFKPAEAVAIARDIAAALTAAHAAGIVHRDVTPGNILLDPTDGARLTDFGIALGGGAESVTATGQLMGTMRFLAPEQLRGAPATPASDLHSLAAVTYEMLAGRPAYAATTPVALAEAQDLGAEPIDTIPPALDAAVRQAMAPEPADRPASVATFAEQLSAGLIADAVTQTISLPAASREPELVRDAIEEWAPAPIEEPSATVVPAAGLGPAAIAESPARSGFGFARSLTTPVGVVLTLVLAGVIFAALSPQDRRPSPAGASPSVVPPTAAATQPSLQPTASASPSASPAAKPAKGHGHKGKHH
jgi:serine/threonine protein kinase